MGNGERHARGTALITGATSGIGYEMADILSLKGYDLVLASRNLETMERIKAEFALRGTQVWCVAIDLSGIAAAQHLFSEVTKIAPPIDILINNAGFGVWGEHVTHDVAQVESMLGLNVISLTTLSGLFGREMKARGSGYILNVASGAGYQPAPLVAAYGASKAYVVNFTEALHEELKDYGVGATVLSPGATDTNFFHVAGVGDAADSMMSKKLRMSPRRVAEIGLDAMFDKRLGVIPGALNNIALFSARLAPRSWVAIIAKKIAAQV
jgi:uncharacterized protein